MKLPDSARELLDSAALAHLVTLNRDGSPHVTIVWVGMVGDEIVFASLERRQKVRNIERDGRVAISLETDRSNAIGLREYLVVEGQARVQEGGGPELLQRLASVYIGPGVRFPPFDDPPPGFVVHITVDRLGGVGPWV